MELILKVRSIVANLASGWSKVIVDRDSFLAICASVNKAKGSTVKEGSNILPVKAVKWNGTSNFYVFEINGIEVMYRKVFNAENPDFFIKTSDIDGIFESMEEKRASSGVETFEFDTDAILA